MMADFVQVSFRIYDLPLAIKSELTNDSELKIGVVGSIPELGSWQSRKMLTAEPHETDDIVWTVTSRLPVSATFKWTWLVTTRDAVVLYFDPAGHRLTILNLFSGTVETSWGRTESHFSSRTSAAKMRIHYHCQPGETMAVLGSAASLGSWDPFRAIRADLSPATSHNWVAQVLLDDTVGACEWKWVVVDSTSGAIKRWEEGSNRRLESSGGRLQMIETRWNCGSVIQYSSSNVDTTRNVEQYVNKDLTRSSYSHHGPDEWLNNANTTDFPFEVTEEEVAVIEAVQPNNKPKCRRSFIRKLSVMLPFLGRLCDFVDLVY